jgi:tetratricopeptide (TPR) repeat protein
MSFNKPSDLPSIPQTPNEISESVFLAVNQEAFDQLVSFVDFAPDRFIIGFAEVNFAPDRITLIEALKQHPRTSDIQFAILDFPDPNLRFLRDAILAELPKIQIDPAKKLMLVVTGLEQSIGMLGDYPPVLQDLNYIRDAFTTSVPHPMLVCLPDYALTRLAKFAPDFWAWRSGVFRFQGTPATISNALRKIFPENTLEDFSDSTSLDRVGTRERIDLQLRLVMQFFPSTRNEHICLNERNLGLHVSNSLWSNYLGVGDTRSAEEALRKTLQLARDEELQATQGYVNAKVFTLYNLGMLCESQSRSSEAIDYLNEALYLILNKQSDSFFLIKSILDNLASLMVFQDDLKQAINFYQQLLALDEEVNEENKYFTSFKLAMALRIEQVESRDMVLFWLQRSMEGLQQTDSSTAQLITENFDFVLQAPHEEVFSFLKVLCKFGLDGYWRGILQSFQEPA